jgi:hypothetical protein
VLGQCAALAHLNLSNNFIYNEAGAECVAGVLAQCAALAHLDLSCNEICNAGAERLASVLPQCAALAHLDLSCNQICNAGAERLASVLPQCTALAHLNLSSMYGNSWREQESFGIGLQQSFASVLPQCTALAHLNLSNNGIDTVVQGRLRASWRGPASGLVFVEVFDDEMFERRTYEIGWTEEDDQDVEV